MVDKAYCSIIKKFRLILHIDNGNAYKNWETAQRRICHYDLYTELYVWISSWWSEYYIILMQHQTFLIKTQVGFIVAGDINFPYKHWFAALSVFVLLTVKCSLTAHTKFIVIFPLQQLKKNVPKYYFTGVSCFFKDYPNLVFLCYIPCFRRVRKIAKSRLLASSCLSLVRTIQSGYLWTDFQEVWYLRSFRKCD